MADPVYGGERDILHVLRGTQVAEYRTSRCIDSLSSSRMHLGVVILLASSEECLDGFFIGQAGGGFEFFKLCHLLGLRSDKAAQSAGIFSGKSVL